MIEPSTQHQEQLEERLLREYDRRNFGAQARRARARWTALGAAGALLVGILAASRAPAEYSAELGQRLEVRAGPGLELPRGPQLAELIRQGLPPQAPGEQRQVMVSLVRTPSGATTLRVDLWGAPIAGIVEQLRARVPELGKVVVTAQPLSGRVRTNLAGLIDHLVRQRSDPAALEEARRLLQLQLAAGGGHSRVEVQLEPGPDGQRRVRVEVEQTQLRDSDAGDQRTPGDGEGDEGSGAGPEQRAP